ncbi:GNAT family N-acetyltransferase [Jannaschia aquimarina]|uniref:YjcF protein n=1 Tax=Jannaschia aquimarina TaxID=935700 RepID=A0A0D1CJU2_9RHOB|nr:GNAT family N-acetyltransferase [Jannaschia aquimarina]KIT15007.1 putative N-acetyltransferase YjcF [Jannaschia aquimarina]SNS61812.1 Predicted N-acyltransferase, GNAT family [Jannaschia aquimarina]
MIARHDELPPEAVAIRRAVFIEEQGIPEPLELDGTDPGFTHWVLHENDHPVATLRSKVTDGEVKIGRVATLARARGRGHAKRLIEAAMEAARRDGATRAYLSAQETVIPWYESLGFTAEGPPYDDAGIPHRDMRKGL